jgi:plasmid stabilization system protein ParE
MKVSFLELARQELDDAVAWYNGQVPELGLAFLDEINRTIGRIVAWPLSSEELMPGIRRCLVNRFPYGLIYAVETDSIVILAVAHLHRYPRYWIDRKAQKS